MLRTLSIAAVGIASAAALAFPAAAETSVKVDVNGLSASAAHARILAAAKAACKTELRNSTTFEQYYQWNGCLNDAVAGAESHLKATADTATRTSVAGR